MFFAFLFGILYSIPIRNASSTFTFFCILTIMGNFVFLKLLKLHFHYFIILLISNFIWNIFLKFRHPMYHSLFFKEKLKLIYLSTFKFKMSEMMGRKLPIISIIIISFLYFIISITNKHTSVILKISSYSSNYLFK